jgi:hypothetical protein
MIHLKRIACVCSLLFLAQPLLAQNTDFDRYRSQQNQAFQNYVSEQDRRFADFLRKEWKKVDLEDAEEVLEDKPEQLPSFLPDKDADKSQKSAQEEPKVIEIPQPITSPTQQPTPVPLSIPRRVPPSGFPLTEVNMLGSKHQVVYFDVFKSARIQRLSNETIADYWITLAGSPYKTAVDDIRKISETYRWSDWATSVFVRRYAETLVSDGNTQVALTWFLLNKLGYTVHVGYQGNRLVIIAPATTKVYAVPRYTLDGSTMAFYMMDYLNKNASGIRSIHTYVADDISHETMLELYIRENPLLQPDVVQKRVKFATIDKAVEADLHFDRNRVDFLKTYPQTDLSVFFNAPVSPAFEESVRKVLGPLLEGKSQGDQLNILLRFVQTGFEYKTDTQQFGRQRFMTPDEIMYYPYSDCDDRAILFSYLVKTLLRLEVIGLEYSTHVATAVRADASLRGDRIMHNGKSYLVCDPTYIMADYGMTMPQFKNERPSIITVF